MQDNPASTAPSLKIDSGLACPVMLAPFHNVAAPEQLIYELAEDGGLFSRAEMLLAAKKLGLKAKFARSALSRLSHTPLPAIATDTDGRFFIITRLDNGKALIYDSQAQRLLERQFVAKHAYLGKEQIRLDQERELSIQQSRVRELSVAKKAAQSQQNSVMAQTRCAMLDHAA